MNRLNLALLAFVVLSALGTVAAQHRARQSFVELERERGVQKQLDEDFGRLQIEQSTWSMHSRIDQVAGAALAMQVPGAERIHVVGPHATTALAAAPAAPAATAPRVHEPQRQAPATLASPASPPASPPVDPHVTPGGAHALQVSARREAR
jgi:cell division protein FtsL